MIPRRASRSLLTVTVLTASALTVGALAGCGLPTGDLIVYAVDDPELEHASVVEGVWESAPWSEPDAPWLAYPARATVQIEHTLGREPRVVLVYLSFDAIGSEPAMAAGDLARVVAVDASTVSIRNETNASFFMRVVAQ